MSDQRARDSLEGVNENRLLAGNTTVSTDTWEALPESHAPGSQALIQTVYTTHKERVAFRDPP